MTTEKLSAPVKIVLVALMIGMSQLALAQAAAPSASNPVQLFLSTSGQGSSYYPLAVALAEVWKKSVPGLNVSLAPGGGVASVVATGKGTAQVGMTLSTSAVEGVMGKAPFKEAYSDLRGFASLDPQAFQYLAYKESGLRKFEQLSGKRVYVNPKNFSSHGLNLMAMSVHGMTLSSFAKAETVGKGDAINLLKDGHLDALLWIGPVPDSLILDASFNRPIQFLEISEAKKAELRKINAGIVPFVVSKGTYPGVEVDHKTLAVRRVLVMNKSVSDDMAYRLAKAMVDHWSELKVADPSLQSMEIKAVATDFGVSSHPGAARYYKEKGWTK